MTLTADEVETLNFVGEKTDGDLRLISIALGEMHGYIPGEGTIKKYLGEIEIEPRKNPTPPKRKTLLRVECPTSRFSDGTLGTMAADWSTYDGNAIRAGRRGEHTYEEYLAGWKNLGLAVAETSCGDVTRRGSSKRTRVSDFGDDPDSLN
jgi:hypothetical protein